MKHLRKLLAFPLYLSVFAAALSAQSVIILPGPGGASQSVPVFSGATLTQSSSVVTPAGAFAILAKPDGSKYYVISSSIANPITVFDSSFSNPRTLAQNLFPTLPSLAAITPDGTRLVVAGFGYVQIFDTSTDQPVAGGVGLGINATPVDMAISLDSRRVFIVHTLASGPVLNAIDISTDTLAGAVTLPTNATAVAVGPNGFAYVSTQGAVLEIDPRTLAIRYTVSVNGRPGKLSFTPDGRYAVAANLTPLTGVSAFLIDLTTHTVSATFSSLQVTFDRVLVAGNNRFLAFSSQTGKVYDGTISPFNIADVSFRGFGGATGGPTAVTGIGLSNELPVGSSGTGTARYLFVQSQGTIYRVDLTTNQLQGQVNVSGVNGPLFLLNQNATGTPAAIFGYNLNQNVNASDTSLPLVVRIVDPNGRPLANVPVTFSTSAAGATLASPTVSTNSEGFAVNFVTTPATAGPLTVNVTAGALTPLAFTLTVGGGSSGGTGTPSGIAIVSGTGQLLLEQSSTATTGTSGTPLRVIVRDANGNAIANAPVAFTVTSGQGTVSNPSTVTDANGIAQTDFLTSSVTPGQSFQTTTVQASSAQGSVTFLLTTALRTMQSGQNAPPPLVELLSPTGRTLMGRAGTVSAGAVQVRVTATSGPQAGQPIPNVGVRIVSSDPTQTTSPASCNAPGGTALTDATGVATCDVAFGKSFPGTAPSLIDVGEFALFDVAVQVSPGPPALISLVQGNNQTGSPGQRLPTALVAQVTDAFGTPLPGAPVTFEVVTPGSVTLSNVVSTSDSAGRVSAVATLGNLAGSYQVRVRSGSTSATYTLTVNIPVTGISAVSGGTQGAVVGQPFSQPLIVQVVDAQGKPVQGAQVTFTVSSGTATLGSQTATTDAQGRAQTTVIAGGTAGPILVTATSSGFNATFALTSRLPGPTNVVFANAASGALGVAPGEIVSLRGNGLAPGITGTITPDSLIGQLPTTLKDVQVTFNGIPAPIYSVSNINGAEQVNVQVPFELQPGQATVVITVKGGSSTLTANVLPVLPGIFETTEGGQRYAVLLRPDGSFVTSANPARRGEIIRMFATGLGQVGPQTAGTNSLGIQGQSSVSAPVIVGVNDAGVRLVSADLSPDLVGLYIVAFQVPSDTAPGPAAKLALGIQQPDGTVVFANGSAIPIQ